MIRVNLFGATTILIDGRSISSHELRGRPRQILEILALAAGSPVPKDRLADLVWEGDPPPSHHGTLESYICVLRRTLGVRSGRESVLATSAGGYQLMTPAVSIDLLDFRRLVQTATTATASTAVGLTLEALDSTHGGLLASEPYAGWAGAARGVFAREAVAAYLRAAGLANGTGAFASATRLACAAVEHDPLCEIAWQHLIRSHWLSGHHAEALRAYAELRQVLLDELGDEPGRDTQELYQAILQESAAGNRRTGLGELRTLLRLLRQSLEALPGAEVPALDSALSAAATRVLASS